VTNVKWDKLSEDEFNELVEMLLVYEYTGNGLVARALNGRGGDGGIDIGIWVEKTGHLIEVLQLKWFPEGFSGGFRQRRKQISESFETAMENHAPPVWTLVVPKNLTTQERKSITAMALGRKVRIRWKAAAELDGILAKHPHIYSYFYRDEYREAVRDMNREEAALAQPDDLAAEAGRLQAQLAKRSRFWGTAFSVDPDGTYVERLYAKRTDAAEHEPLSISFSTQFSEEHEELRERFADKMKYGGSGTIVLPEGVLQEFNRNGPEWFAKESRGGELHISDSGDYLPQKVKVETHDSRGGRLGRLSGETRTIDRGYGGTSIETALRGGLEIRWRFPDDSSENGQASLTLNPVNATPRELRQALAFLSTFEDATQVGLAVDELPALTLVMAPSDEVKPAPELLELTNDLCLIEDKLGVLFHFPEGGADITDRIWARVVVLMLEGKSTPMPYTDSFTGTLSGTMDPGMAALLEKGGAVCISNPDWALQMFGETVEVGPVWVYSHHAVVANAEDVIQAYGAGSAAGMKIQVHPLGDLPFQIYAPGRLGGGDAVIKAHPWGLVGVDEHPKFHELPNAYNPESASELPPEADIRRPKSGR